MSTVLNMNVPVVVNEPPVIHSTAVSGITAPPVDVLPIWPAIVLIADAPSVTPPITFLSTVLSGRTRAWASSSIMETPRGFNLVPVAQVLDGGIVTVWGHGLIFSVVHLLPLTNDSPFTFTILVIFFTDTFRYIVW